MYNTWNKWREWRRETSLRNKEKDSFASIRRGISLTYCFCLCMKKHTARPCLMLRFVLLSIIWAPFSFWLIPSCQPVFVCPPSLLYFSTGSAFHGWISQSSPSSSVWFLHFPPVWRSCFPLRQRKRKENPFTILLSVEMASDMSTKTL